jgi:large subunit ribosomal protein L22
MTATKTNERPGTKAVLRHFHMSATKARVVLNLIRGEDVNTARDILAGTTREAADIIGKVLASAVANAVNNDGLNADDLYVAACYADEGVTMKRFTPRARGRAGKILKRSCHITVVVARMDDDKLEILRAARNAQAVATRTRRVASSRKRADQTASLNKRETRDAEAALEAENADVETTEVIETEVMQDVATTTVADETNETVSVDAAEETDN